MSEKRETLTEKLIYRGKIFDVISRDIRVSPENGESQLIKRDIVKHLDAVAIAAITEDNHLLVVNQYRDGVEKRLTEIPAGLIDEGEIPIEAARRELEEETGYRAENMLELAVFYTSPGFTSEKITLFLAEGLSKISHPRPLDVDEFLELGEWSLADVKRGLEQAASKAWNATTLLALHTVLPLMNQKLESVNE